MFAVPTSFFFLLGRCANAFQSEPRPSDLYTTIGHNVFGAVRSLKSGRRDTRNMPNEVEEVDCPHGHREQLQNLRQIPRPTLITSSFGEWWILFPTFRPAWKWVFSYSFSSPRRPLQPKPKKAFYIIFYKYFSLRAAHCCRNRRSLFGRAREEREEKKEKAQQTGSDSRRIKN